MPKPVPPPPPQPSVEETRVAVRFVGGVCAVALGFFLLIASSYGPHNWFLQYGRDAAPSWNLWRLDNLDEEQVRAHDGGKVAWLVGSSILRESFDENAINEQLAARGSEYRVVKFGIARGAAGVVAGFAEQLPLREGDLLVHNVTLANFHAGWVSWTGLPPDQMMYTVPQSEFWHIDGWGLPDKLEQAVAVPTNFWQWHEDIMGGKSAWVEAVWWLEAPKKKRAGHHVKFQTVELKQKYLDKKRGDPVHDPIYLDPACCDLTDAQFNMRGIRRMEALAAAHGVALALIHIPPRAEYEATFVHRDATPQWDAWRAETPSLSYAPRPPDDDYYDWKHPNFRGRALLSPWLVEWLESGRPKGEPAPLTWPVPDFNQPGVPVDRPAQGAGSGARDLEDS